MAGDIAPEIMDGKRIGDTGRSGTSETAKAPEPGPKTTEPPFSGPGRNQCK